VAPLISPITPNSPAAPDPPPVPPAGPPGTADAVPTAGSGGAAVHRTSVSESGAFVAARCTCGWRGPARRARDRARRDAEEHTGH
jgi:hypothetical protein